MTKIIGIDYSLTGPCLCICNDRPIISECEFHYLTKVKKYEGSFMGGRITGYPFKDYNSQQERHDQISNWVFEIIGIGYDNPIVFIEDYSFGSKGRVFNLAENTGLLKHKLYKRGIKFHTLVPSVIKKAATGKGNAYKEKMFDHFYEETGIHLMEELDQTTLNNPVTDIVDSYYIAMVGYENEVLFKGKK